MKKLGSQSGLQSSRSQTEIAQTETHAASPTSSIFSDTSSNRSSANMLKKIKQVLAVSNFLETSKTENSNEDFSPDPT
jgi:hypothetical protein